MNNPYSKEVENDGIDLNMNNYTLQDVLNILDIPVNTLIVKSEADIHKMIESKINNMIKKFENLNLIKFVTFFEKMKETFLTEYDSDSRNSEISNNKIVNQQQEIDNHVTMHYEDYNPTKIFKNEYERNNILSNFNMGNINPLSRKYVQKLINIDSKYRKNYDQHTSTNFVVELTAKIQNVIEMKLNDLEMVNTFYVISDEYQNNHFWIKFTTTTDSYFYVFVFLDPHAHYEEFIIETINTSFQELNFLVTISVDVRREVLRQIPEGTGKLSFIVTDPRISFAEFHFESDSLPNFKESDIYNSHYDKHQFVYVSELYNKSENENEFFPRVDLIDSIYSRDLVKTIYEETPKNH